MKNDKNILSGKFSFVIKIIIAVFVLVFLLPPGGDFGIKDSENVQSNLPNESAQNSELEDKEKVLSEDLILKKPSEHPMEFEMVMKAINKAWENLELDQETFEMLNKNKIALETVNKLLDYRQESTEIPESFNLALQNYVQNDSSKEEIVHTYFDGNVNFSLAREYQNGQWNLMLRSKIVNAGTGNDSSHKESSNETVNKQVELD